MANIARWVAGASPGLGYANAFDGEVNSLAAGSCVISSIPITNSGLDLYASLSFKLTCSTPASGSLWMTFFVLPINQDGITYGPGNFPASSPGGALPAGASSY